MEIQEQIARLADALDQDAAALTPETRLDDLGWDSMGILSVIALARANGIKLEAETAADFETVGDILKAAF